jgi:fermentation-respiration switch protein FrsA (DUF1100 family)
LGLPKYAEKFVELGIAVFVFDYRCFGKSEGGPRQLLDIEKQQEDYLAAIRYVRENPHINAQKIVLWGTSFSGGHVLAVAAVDSTIAAVISQVPLIDGRYRGRDIKESHGWKVTKLRLRYIGAAIVDLVGSWFGLSPYFVPVVAAPGKLAAFIEPEAKLAFEALGGEKSGWKNALAPRFFFKFLFKGLPKYKNGTVEKLKMPMLMCLADNDTQASAEFAAELALKAPNAEIIHYSIGHFEAYLSPNIERMMQDQINFLRKTLLH